MVDIVLKDWYKFVDLFYKLFLIMCHDGQQRLEKFHVAGLLSYLSIFLAMTFPLDSWL